MTVLTIRKGFCKENRILVWSCKNTKHGILFSLHCRQFITLQSKHCMYCWLMNHNLLQNITAMFIL